MSESPFPVQCESCSKLLFGPVKYCPYCGVQIEFPPVLELADEPMDALSEPEVIPVYPETQSLPRETSIPEEFTQISPIPEEAPFIRGVEPTLIPPSKPTGPAETIIPTIATSQGEIPPTIDLPFATIESDSEVVSPPRDMPVPLEPISETLISEETPHPTPKLTVPEEIITTTDATSKDRPHPTTILSIATSEPGIEADSQLQDTPVQEEISSVAPIFEEEPPAKEAPPISPPPSKPTVPAETATLTAASSEREPSPIVTLPTDSKPETEETSPPQDKPVREDIVEPSVPGKETRRDLPSRRKTTVTFQPQTPITVGLGLWRPNGDQEKGDTTTSREPPVVAKSKLVSKLFDSSENSSIIQDNHSQEKEDSTTSPELKPLTGLKPSSIHKSPVSNKLFDSRKSPLVTQDNHSLGTEPVEKKPEDITPTSKVPLRRGSLPKLKQKPEKKTDAAHPKPGIEQKSPPLSPDKKKLVRQTSVSGIFGVGSKVKNNDDEK